MRFSCGDFWYKFSKSARYFRRITVSLGVLNTADAISFIIKMRAVLILTAGSVSEVLANESKW